MFEWRNHKDTPVHVRLDVTRHVEIEDVAHLGKRESDKVSTLRVE